MGRRTHEIFGVGTGPLPGEEPHVLAFRAQLWDHSGYERKEVVRLHTSHETLEVTGC
jgi:hypothetical protein